MYLGERDKLSEPQRIHSDCHSNCNVNQQQGDFGQAMVPHSTTKQIQTNQFIWRFFCLMNGKLLNILTNL